MTELALYRGLWPQNVSKTAKYVVKFVDGEWKVTVQYEFAEGLMYLAVESGGSDIADRVNHIKQTLNGQNGGVFYINEYQHLIVPVAREGTSHYFYGGQVDPSFVFVFEGTPLTNRPVDRNGLRLSLGDPWVGTRPGIPYVLAAGCKDIFYETSELTDATPPSVREGVTRKVKLSTTLRDPVRVASAVRPIAEVRGHQGGRFYVNEHGASFTPVDRGDGNGLNYIYCGQIDQATWFGAPSQS